MLDIFINRFTIKHPTGMEINIGLLPDFSDCPYRITNIAGYQLLSTLVSRSSWRGALNITTCVSSFSQ